jgi:L,D-peptidoglycan transpeptidase YkuD (ErfK/YbiS/YcfS/YnhG family)
VPATAASCAGLANELASTRGARQLITVVAPATSSTTGELTLWTRNAGCWRAIDGPWPARLGRNGLSAHHREGDGTTPAGAFGLGSTVYGVAPDPGVRYRYHRLVCGDWWDEDPTTPSYNRFVHVPCGTRPAFGGGSEALWLATGAYAHFAVIAYNADPVVPGRGSAIFLHADVGSPTNGCVSLPLRRLDAVLRVLRPDASPLVVIGTADAIRRY